MFIYFTANKLIFKNKFGFQPRDSCINQKLVAFLDIYKVFDKVWHEELIFKLKQNGIFGEPLHILFVFF